MTEPTAEGDRERAVRTPSAATTAGALLRQARQAQGLHIGALAASIKVPQRKLESLEADRYAELPDITFTRALAKTVCRALRIDAAPVLALLPRLSDGGLGQVHQGLNTPFRERPGRIEPGDWKVLARPAVWIPVLLVIAAGIVFLLPQKWISETRPFDAAAPAASAAAGVAPAAASVPAAAVVGEPVAVFPPEAVASSAAATEAPPAVNSLLELTAASESWVEVVDANGAALIQRVLHPGETVGLDGALPLRVKIGNAAATQLSFRGQPVPLAPLTRDNVARLELK